MASLSSLQTNRLAAGASYVSAATALVASFVELSALDQFVSTPLLLAPNDLIQEGNAVAASVLPHSPWAPTEQRDFPTPGPQPAPSFNGGPDGIPQHPQFQAVGLTAGWSDKIRARIVALMATFKPTSLTTQAANLVTVKALRATQGATYASAATALAAAYVELAANDAVVMCGAVGGGLNLGVSFGGTGLHLPMHAEFFRTVPTGSPAFADAIRARLTALINS